MSHHRSDRKVEERVLSKLTSKAQERLLDRAPAGAVLSTEILGRHIKRDASGGDMRALAWEMSASKYPMALVTGTEVLMVNELAIEAYDLPYRVINASAFVRQHAKRYINQPRYTQADLDARQAQAIWESVRDEVWGDAQSYEESASPMTNWH
jgi:hypothetical protein